jgi:hypothetical protein
VKIEGTPEEIADFVRRMLPAEDIKPILAPQCAPRIQPDWLPYIGDYPPPATDRIPYVYPFWQAEPYGTQIGSGPQRSYTCANVKEM